MRRKTAIGLSLCITSTAWIVPLPAEASAFTIDAVQSGKHDTPNLFDPRSNSQSGPARKLLSPTLGTQPADNLRPGTRGGAPNAKPRNDAGLMVPESFQLSAGSPGHFLSRDGRLEIDVPAEALSASDVAADGGSTSLAVSQVSPGSGSNAGGSGHFSYGTFLLQAVDAKGKLAKHGLRAPVSLKLHVGSQGTGLDVTNSYLVLNASYRGQLGAPSSLAGQEALPMAATAPMGPMTNVSTVFDPAAQTISAMASLLSPSTAASFGTNSTSVATFGKPQPFEANLSGGALTAGYPLDIPSGPKGMKPPLVLFYNSAGVNGQHNAQGAAGWVGEGWNMSMGAISWAEHYVADAGGTAWQDSWQLSDPYGTAVSLIPPTTSTAIYQEDSGRAIATSPVQWQTNPMIYAKIYSFQSGLTIAGNPTPPCWRVFLTNGLMEEFGCTADSLEYYPNSAGKAYIYSWLLDMIVEPDGNQIHVTYNRDMQTLFGFPYPRDAVLNTVEWDSPTCSNTSTMCTPTGTAPNLWAPLLRVSFSASHAVVRSPSGSTNCGAAIGNLRCDDPVDLTASGGVGIPSVQSDYVLNDIYVQVCNAGCSSTPTWNMLKDYQLGYDQSGPGSIPIDPISGKTESTAGRLNLTQVTVYGDDGSTALPTTNYTYTKVVEYYEDSLFFPAGAGGIGLCSLSVCQNGSGSTNCGPSPGVGAINTGYTPYQRGCVLWSQTYDGNSYYLSSASNGIGLTQSFTWVNLRSNLHGTDWWNGHNGGYWNFAYNPTWCNTNQSNIYPCNMADDGVWSRVGLASRTDNLVRLTQNGQGGAQTSTPVSGTTYYTYQDVFPLAVQVCPLYTNSTPQYPSACVAGFSWGSAYDNDYLDFYNGIFMGFTQVQVTNPDGSVEAHKFYSAEGWGGWGPNNAQGGTVGLSIICPYSNIDTCWSDPYWDVANQTSYPGQANALHGREYQVDRYDTNGATLLDQVKTQYNPVCTPPIIPAGSPSVSGYTNNGWNGNLVSALDLGNPEVSCDVQIIQVDHYRYDGATGTVPDQTTTYAYETGARPCATCYGREIKTTTSINDGNINGNPVNIVKRTAYTWNDSVLANSNSVSGPYLINFVGFTDTEDTTGNRKQCTYTSYDQQPNVLGATGGLTKGDVTRSSNYTDCTSIVIANELATTSFYDNVGNLVAQRDPNMSYYNGGTTPRSGCVAPSQGDLTFFTTCTAFDNYFKALTIKRDNLGAATTIAYQTPTGATGGGGFGLWPMSTTDWNNQTTGYTYDALGRPTSVTQPLETAGLTTQSMAYAVWCSGSAAQSPCVEIDQVQRLNSTQTVTARTFYDGAGNVVETRNPGPTGQDVVQYSFYDPSQRQVFRSVPYLVATYTGAPGAGAYSIPDSTVAGTSSTYDGLGRTKSVKNPVSSTISLTYGMACNTAGTGDSACYNQALTDDPLNHRSGVLKDAMGRILYEQKYSGNSAATWAVYATTKYQYDFVGNLIWILHPDGANNTTTQYDMAGRETSNFDGDVRQQNFTYDKNGNLTQMVDGRQSAAGTTYFGYDLLNRPIWRNTTNTPTGAYDTYSYDSTANGNFGVGRLTSETFTAAPANSLSGSEGFVYDARGRQISSTLTVGANSYLLRTAYDDAGNVLNQTYPTGEVVTNSLTAQGWLSGVGTTMGSATLLSGAVYAGTGGASGLITGGSLAGGLYQYNASFDLLARAYDVNLKKGTTTLFDQTRTFDASGNVTTANTTLPSGTDNQAFCYDEQNRVVAAASSGTVPCQIFSAGTLSGANYNQSFAYDNLGRLTNGPLGAYSYAGAIQPHGASKIGTSYTAAYDGAGNMTCRAATSASTCQGTQTGAQLAYNNQGQLSNWQDKPGTPSTTGAFLYDGQGTRVAQQVVQGGVTTTSVYIGNIQQVTYVVGGTGTSTPVNVPVLNSLVGTGATTMQTASLPSNAMNPSSPAVSSSERADSKLQQSIAPREQSGVEQSHLRTRTSRTYARSDGTLQTVIYMNTINYRDEAGHWQPIDNTLVVGPRDSGIHNKANAYQLQVPINLADEPVRVTRDGEWVAFALVGGRGKASLSADTASYIDSTRGVKVTFSAHDDAVKEAISLRDAASPNSFAYALKSSAGLTAKANTSGGIDFLDAAGRPRFAFAPPFMVDSSGIVSRAVTLTLGNTAAEQLVTLTADALWLARKERTWPVVIDPTLTMNGALQDCYLKSGSRYRDISQCGSTSLEVGYALETYDPGTVGAMRETLSADPNTVAIRELICPGTCTTTEDIFRRSLLKFDLTGIPANVPILSAELGLNLSSETTTTAAPVSVHQLTTAWTPGATWNSSNGVAAWTTAGGDFAPTAAYTNNGVGGVLGWYYWYPTQLVSDWVNGVAVNNGLIVKQAPPETVSNVLSFYSSASTNPAAQRPYLTVTYNQSCTVPAAPGSVSATPGNQQATVSWTAPTNGGCAISGYTVTPYVGTTAGAPVNVNGTTTSTVVTALTNGTTYTFKVTATNSVGIGPAGVSNAVTPATVPDAPTIGAATAGNTQATVSWTAPVNTGGSAVTGYVVTPYIGATAQTATTFNSTATTQTVTGLTNGTAYTFRVAAINAIGTGPASAQSNSVTPLGPPGAPTNVTGTAGNAQVTLSWTAPISTGGSAITGYVVTPYIGTTAQTATTFNSAATTQTVTGLTNGTAYTFTVAAINAQGTGAASGASAAVTPATVPGAPTGVSAIPGNQQATVSWTAPASNGGSAITGYVVTPYIGATAQTATTFNTPSTAQIVTGLTNGTGYTFVVAAINAAGTGPASAPSATVTPATVPSAPTGVTATGGNAQATVSWTAPTSNGGATLTGYTVTPYVGTTAGTPVNGSATTTSTTVTGLTNGTTYTFQVAATNSVGTGPAGTSNSVTLTGPPGAPTGVTATPANGQATVSWTAPASSGGSAITGYVVTPYVGTTAQTGTTFNSTATTQIVTGLTNGTAYTFTVAAVNAVGTSPASAPSNSVTPAAPPGAPTNVTATGGNGQATVSWTASASNGGSAITSYTVTSSPGGLSATTPNGATTTATVGGLSNGIAYTFTVTAANSAGTSPASAPSNSVTPAAPPGAPTSVTATAGNGQAAASWTAPASNGGSAISSYTVTASPGGMSAQTPNGTTTSATVIGLANGTAYTFTVTATNSAGPGPASAPSNSVTPVGPPSAPSNVAATAGNAQASVSWTASAYNGGAAITGYTVASSPGGLTASVNGSTTTATVTGLTNGSAYTFTITAANSAGTSPASAPSNSVTPAAPPGAPTSVTAAAGNTQATVSWTAPSSNGGAAITSYTVTSSPGALTATSSTTTATVTGLANGTSYTFTVTATNWAGTGPASVASNAVVPAGPPAVPTNVGATAGNAQASVTWTAPASSNGAAITSYTVTSTPGGLAASVNGSTTTATVTGLTNGTSYTFSVTATNSAGTSAASSPSNSVTPAAPPGAPTNVATTGGMGQATVTWTAPASNGGAAITSYAVTSSPGGISVTTPDGATTTATVTGLTNGTAYTFTVTAANWAGTGAASAASNAVTPGVTIRTYYYANGLRIATALNGVVSYLVSDGLGSANLVLNSSGSVTASQLFAPYGILRYSSGTMPTDYGFTGQHSDSSTGLMYYGSRYYDPVAGQFTSADTIVPGGGYDIWGLSRYAYAEGNPIARVDPTGHNWWDAVVAAVTGTYAVVEQDIQDFSIGVTNTVVGLLEATPPIGTAIEISKWLNPNSPERQEMGIFLNNGSPNGDSYQHAQNYQVGVEQNQIIATIKNYEAHPFQLVGTLSVAIATLGLSRGAGVAGTATGPDEAVVGPKLSPKFQPPTNPPQLPPTYIPPGWRIREMPSAPGYPNGYWKLEKPMADGSWQPIDPSTMQPGSPSETHVPFPRS
ncbi:MAG TPA: fibronectin type III domain-containing protein [Candidatus Eisenbacteria bacterium]|nr:fibronectin type III domain-containing protein [Candidatus Eisenbacteria bacterium]